MNMEPASTKHPRFRVILEEPLNGGPPLDLLVAERVTPIPSFYVRNHGATPAVDLGRFQLTVDGLVQRPLALGIEALAARFARREVEATLQCAGHRRDELMRVRPIEGELAWGSEAIGNALWSGFALADLLQEAGIRSDARDVAFEGLDTCERGGARFPFGGSIPLEKATAPETLLADRMNGTPLTPLHGFPLRSLVPGSIGARSVKWLTRITVGGEPSHNYFQRKAYRLLPPGAKGGDEAGPMLGDFPVNCLIARPLAGTVLAAGPVEVAGVAFAGGGRRIARVEVATDGGRTWLPARLDLDAGPWAWRRFTAQVVLERGPGTIVARAWDDSGATQPEHADQVWNAKGYVNNAWARVTLEGR